MTKLNSWSRYFDVIYKKIFSLMEPQLIFNCNCLIATIPLKTVHYKISISS